MKVNKFFSFGLGACALLGTSLSANFVDCPKGNEIKLNSMKRFSNFEPFTLKIKGSINQSIQLIQANEDQTCFYTYGEGALGFYITKKDGNKAWCPVVNIPPKIGFDCS